MDSPDCCEISEKSELRGLSSLNSHFSSFLERRERVRSGT